MRWANGAKLSLVRMKLAVVVCVSVLTFTAAVVPPTSGEDRDGRQDPCRVAVAVSGDAKPFADPGVHRSFRFHVLESIKKNGCQVDVFAYAMLEDDNDFQGDTLGFMRELANIETSFNFLAPTPTRVLWHQDQTGPIPKSCPESSHFYDGGTASPGGGRNAHHGGVDAGRGDRRYGDQAGEADGDLEGPSRIRAYWRLYGSLAAYRMAVQKEGEGNEDSGKDGGSVYDWIVATRFDVAWLRPLPPLHTFSREVVWVGASVWPISNDFALVPRAFADRYFSAVSAFHSCDGGSWPPGESWWQPDCGGGGGFQESVVFRHLHANNVAYRPYPMFDYYVAQPHREDGGGSGDGGGERGDDNGCDVRAGVEYNTVCVILEAAGLLPSSRDCDAALSEYAGLRCRALTGLHLRERVVAETLLEAEDPTAWEAALVGAPRVHQASATVLEEGEGDEEQTNARFSENEEGLNMGALHDLDRIRLKLVSLRDAVWVGFKALKMQFEGPEFRQSQQRLSEQRRVEEAKPEEMCYSWTIHSQHGCGIGEYSGRAPHMIRSFSTEPSLMKEMALATMCLAHRLSGAYGLDGGAGDFSMCFGSSFGYFDVDHAPRSLELVTADVLLHSEQLGVCTADGSSGFTATEHVQRFFAEPSAHCVGYGDRPAKPVATMAATTSATAAVVTANKLDAKDGNNIIDLVVAHPDTVVAAATTVAALEASQPKVVGGVESPTPGETEPGSSTCPALLVQEMDVWHPKDGAVYWEGPVNVSLGVTLAGPGVQDLDLRYVHACADTENSWPIMDWSRYCVSLEELASPDSQPSLVFGSTIGVVEGSVSLRDARPGCFPVGSPRGGVLLMAEGLDSGRSRLASTTMRFKIIHHVHNFRHRGRPIGPAPLGRGHTSVQDLIEDLEREAEEEASAAIEEMESYRNLSRGTVVELNREPCSSRLSMTGRGTAIASTGHQAQFYADQLEWMISAKKLPKEMAFAVDRMRELQAYFPDDSSEAFVSTPAILNGWWGRIGPFFQKGLLLPMPAPEKVVSTSPLHTWEYDEIPWMEALNPYIDWEAVEEAYLGNQPVPITHVDDFFSPKAVAILLDLARGNSIFVESRVNYVGAYPSEGMSHPILYQIAEEAAARLPRILGRDTPGWPMVQTWFYMYGGNDGKKCTHGIKVHADIAMVNVNVWLAPDSANLGGAQTGDGGGLTVFHARPPEDWDFMQFNRDSSGIEEFLMENQHAGSTSVPVRQNRALLFDSMLFHQSDPFRFKTGFANRRLNLTFLFGRREQPPAAGESESDAASKYPREMREVRRGESGQLHYCL